MKKSGAVSVRAYITHPVLSGQAIQNIMDSDLDEIVITDTIPVNAAAQACKKIRVISLADMLAQAIKRVNIEQSVSSMFPD